MNQLLQRCYSVHQHLNQVARRKHVGDTEQIIQVRFLWQMDDLHADDHRELKEFLSALLRIRSHHLGRNTSSTRIRNCLRSQLKREQSDGYGVLLGVHQYLRASREFQSLLRAYR